MIVFFFAKGTYDERVDARVFGDYQSAEEWLRAVTVNDWPTSAIRKTTDGWRDLRIRYEDGKLILGE